MPRLKERFKQIPNGLRFYLPQIKWHAPSGSSFNRIVDGVMAAVAANPEIAKRNNWPATRAAVEDWVDEFNATICLRMGYNDFIIQAGSFAVPKWEAPQAAKSQSALAAAAGQVKELVAGARSLSEFVQSKDEPVAPEKASGRAAICINCPKNEPGDFTRWFTVPAAELIRRQVEQTVQRGLSTPYDSRLNLCTACHCPLRLKVHVPIEYITKRLSPEARDRLKQVKQCWIISEAGL